MAAHQGVSSLPFRHSISVYSTWIVVSCAGDVVPTRTVCVYPQKHSFASSTWQAALSMGGFTGMRLNPPFFKLVTIHRTHKPELPVSFRHWWNKVASWGLSWVGREWDVGCLWIEQNLLYRKTPSTPPLSMHDRLQAALNLAGCIWRSLILKLVVRKVVPNKTALKSNKENKWMKHYIGSYEY